MKEQILLLLCFFITVGPYMVGNEITPISVISNTNLSEKSKISWFEKNFLTKNICTNTDFEEIQKQLPKVSPYLAVVLYKFLYYQGYPSKYASDMVLQNIITSLNNKNISGNQIVPAIIEFLSFSSTTEKRNYPKYLKLISLNFLKQIHDDSKMLEIILEKDNDYYEYIRSELSEGTPLNSSVELEYVDRVECSSAYRFLDQILSSQEKQQVEASKNAFYKTLLDFSEKENYYQQYGLLKLYAIHLLQNITANDLKLIRKYKKSASRQIVELVDSITKDIEHRSPEKNIQIYDNASEKNASTKISSENPEMENYLRHFMTLLEAEKPQEIKEFLRRKEISSQLRIELFKIYYYYNYNKDKVDAAMWDIFQSLFDDPITKGDFLLFLSTPLSGIKHKIQISENLQNEMISYLISTDDKNLNIKFLLNIVTALAQVNLPFPKKAAEAILKALEYQNDPIFRKACIFSLKKITSINNESPDLNFWRKAISSMPNDPIEEKEHK